eukprot:scpid96526/ scgid17532/ 
MLSSTSTWHCPSRPWGRVGELLHLAQLSIFSIGTRDFQAIPHCVEEQDLLARIPVHGMVVSGLRIYPKDLFILHIVMEPAAPSCVDFGFSLIIECPKPESNLLKSIIC